MDPILESIYSTIIPSAPYVIAAYVLLWAALFIYVFIVMRNLKKAEDQLSLIEEAIEESSTRND